MLVDELDYLVNVSLFIKGSSLNASIKEVNPLCLLGFSCIYDIHDNMAGNDKQGRSGPSQTLSQKLHFSFHCVENLIIRCFDLAQSL